jgi:alkylated DNA repair dioxygenase AlkB
MSESFEAFRYQENLLPPLLQTEVVSRLQGLTYEHQAYGPAARARNYQGSDQILQRGYVQLGHAYEHTGEKRDYCEVIPDFLLDLIPIGLPVLGQVTDFNQCVVMHYPVGTGVEWHTDGDRFGQVIMGVSLGGEGIMQFRRRGDDRISHHFSLMPGSIYILRDEVRWHYQHRILPVTDERWSLTYRTIRV